MTQSRSDSINEGRDLRPGAGGKRTKHRLIAIAAAMLSAIALPQTAAAQSAGKEWTTPGGTLEGTRYSSLTQINTTNAAGMIRESWSNSGISGKGSTQGQPLVIGDRMYVVTPFPNKLIAYNLRRPGEVLWTYSPEPNEYATGMACCDVVNRGAAYANGKIIYNLLDDSTVAVDAISGRQIWRTRLGDVRRGETTPGAPLIIKDKVIVGNAGGELGIRGWVMALDVNTGKVVWKAYNTGPDAEVKIGANFKAYYPKDQGADLGLTSWPTPNPDKAGTGSLWRQGGATAWNWFTYDPQLNLFYYGTSNPGVWNPDQRPGDNKWAASIIARNPDTGDAVWANQLTPHDGWDFDAESESTVVDITIGGVKRRALVHFDKNGFAYTLDARTGEILVAEKFAHVTWADHVDKATGIPAVVPGMMPQEGAITKNICPSPFGGKNYVPAAYSEQTKLFYVPALNLCWDFEPLRAIYIPGAPFGGIHAVGFYPGPGGNMSEFIAWDPATGQKKWGIVEPSMIHGGALATAGNLVFYGTLGFKGTTIKPQFKVVNAQTGAVIKAFDMPCGVTGSPITFQGSDSKQRVVVYTGVGFLAGGFAGGTCAGRINVFRLP